jgi:predicted nucleic acid-binding protein
LRSTIIAVRHRAAEIAPPISLPADALHIANMTRRGVQSIVSFDTDFDRCPPR